MTKLPADYLQQMKDLLKDQFDDYLESFEEKRSYGLRVNTSKISVEDFLKISPFSLTPIPWTKDGFYYDEEERPSRHPYYFAGLYYLQEPSAMLPAEALPIEEGDIVLDCCGAPGGKTSKLANRLHRTGMLVANDISVSRAQVMLKTLETQGVINSYVMAEDITGVSGFDGFFDKILIDAPCSGEGMFRKESDLIRAYSERGSEYYAPIQKQIIAAAIKMLKPGGMMVYSTCTFDPKEDEEVIEYALDLCADLEVLPIGKCEGFACGISERTKDCVRLYPHLIRGEGHFVALLQKKGKRQKTDRHIAVSKAKDLPEQLSFLERYGEFISRSDRLFLIPPYDIKTAGLRILRSGLYLGEMKHGRFEPSQALAMAIKKDEYENVIDLSVEDERVLRYLRCETLNVRDFDAEGFCLVCVDGFPLGFGKVSGGTLKNRYPANYRYQ